ncbi:hypothetical protein I314_00257 [Cryptococcus bacillisporus CA1873]|uniref:Uncharacterized protein n=1 Tax=Cryptococcus bacillisporus CA1873 TaxID=1296111 RepID=A0ABR5BIZ8_CRYGA|nr:hypothetical protein I314_00257 [Cryptococcus bacillisporus CA1873]|eukprot:KIR69153.1 hypothetical protein I314_00257 [Cryptococcus gattii CA1873]
MRSGRQPRERSSYFQKEWRMLRKALCNGRILPLVKFYTSQEGPWPPTPGGVDEFVLFSELYAGHQELDPATIYMARDIPLLNEKVRVVLWIAYAVYHLNAVRSKLVFHAPMDRWDRTVNFKATGNIGEDADDEDPEVYLTKGMVDEEEIQESRYDVMRSSLLEDPELELSYPPFLDLIKTHEWNHLLPVDAETLWNLKLEGSQSW